MKRHPAAEGTQLLKPLSVRDRERMKYMWRETWVSRDANSNVPHEMDPSSFNLPGFLLHSNCILTKKIPIPFSSSQM